MRTVSFQTCCLILKKKNSLFSANDLYVDIGDFTLPHMPKTRYWISKIYIAPGYVFLLLDISESFWEIYSKEKRPIVQFPIKDFELRKIAYQKMLITQEKGLKKRLLYNIMQVKNC